MSFPPETIFFDVGWEQAFWDATEALDPESHDIDFNELTDACSFFTPHPAMSLPLGEIDFSDTHANEPASSLASDHGFVKDAMQRRSHCAKGRRRKNRKDKWFAIDRIVKARKAAGKESDVYLDKQLINPRKLQKNTSRPRLMQPFEKYAKTPLPPIPRDFEIRTPPLQGGISTWTQELPFMQFRNTFPGHATTHIHPSGIPNRSSDSALHQTVSTMHSEIVMPMLGALLPACMSHAYSIDSPKEGLRVERASGAYFDLLSFSLANNFAGLDGLPPQHVLDYLKTQSTAQIAHLMRSVKGQTGRALAEKLFTYAIEAHDTATVEIILRHSQNTKVDVNKAICKYNGFCYTPIELSSGLKDIETTRVLLEYGADCNKTLPTYKSSRRVGALSCALDWTFAQTYPLSFRLIQLLLEHGAQVTGGHLENALERRELEIVYALFRTGVRQNHEEWGNSGLFGRVVEALDDEAATDSIKILKQIGADINAPQGRHEPTMLDMAAKRGSHEMVLMLLHLGAVETETTLSYAIQSRNRVVIELFLREGKADSLSCGKYPTTPYAEAIQMGDETLMQVLEGKGSWSNMKERCRYIVTLDAASEVGNVEVIERLLKTSPEIKEHELFGTLFHSALVTAVEENHEEIAIMLVHAGARGHMGVGPRALEKALLNRNPEIVRALLNFGENPCNGHCSELWLAVQWGEISIIEDLLVSGFNINLASSHGETPLTSAVRKKDRKLIRFLLNAGSNINITSYGSGHGSTALSTAIEMQDIDTINYLLCVGADPGDPAALLESCKKGGNILGLLLQAFLTRYPNGKKGYFDVALAEVVQKNDITTLEYLRPVMALKFPGYSQHIGELIGRRLIFSNEISLKAIQILLDSGANPKAVVGSADLSKRIPLLSAAIEAKSTQMVQILLDNGADVNFPATRGVRFTAIQEAAKIGCREIVQMLIDQGADVDAAAAEKGGGTAIQLAAIGGFVGIADLLLQNGAKINRSPSIIHGRTALEGAAEHGRLDMVQFLLQSGAQIDGPGQNSFLNAMKLAEDNGHFVVLELLQSHLP